MSEFEDEFDDDDEDFAQALLQIAETEDASTSSTVEVASNSGPEVDAGVSLESVTRAKGALPTPAEFPFPFPPYSIQSDFMRHLYRALDEGKIGVFESPTGTGKSLSLICGALLWLRDFDRRRKVEVAAQVAKLESSLSTADSDAGDDWIAAHESRFRLQRLLEPWKEIVQRDETLRVRLDAIRGRSGVEDAENPRKRRRIEAASRLGKEFETLYPEGGVAGEAIGEDEIESDEIEDRELLVDVAGKEEDDVEDDDKEQDEKPFVLKIFFCSRTHSQLTQFVSEVRKSPYGEDVRLVALASRQNLCVNEGVRKWKSLQLINERCQEMRDAKKGSAKRCPYYKQEAIQALSDRILTSVADIEDLASLGRRARACPYYASRSGIPLAEIVVLPYNLLLHKSTREACGIDLKDQIVIIDEAHNLIDTITSVHSVEVTLSHIECAHAQLTSYLTKYQKRLKTNNVLAIRQILFILNRLKVTLEKIDPGSPDVRLLTLYDFLDVSDLVHQTITIPRLLKYMADSQICRKLQGFADKYSPSALREAERAEKADPNVGGVTRFLEQLKASKKVAAETKTSKPASEESKAEEESWRRKSPLTLIRGFLESLLSDNQDGRIVLKSVPSSDRNGNESLANETSPSEPSLRFLLLNPAKAFADVIADVRSLVLAGGTMEPVDEVENQLFAPNGVGVERILRFSCGHVVPKENLLPFVVGKGPSGMQMEFTFKNRGDSALVSELGQLLLNFSRVTPGGVVVFFPSYDYERLVHGAWDRSGLLSKLQRLKRIFREPKSSSQLENLLGKYSACAKANGAILFSVVGGKMSEGINFSDDLGRLVVMVGLPYPNKFSPELKEKMRFLDATLPASSPSPGQRHYENLCMKAVNQSVGRAIRHRADYAAIAFVDSRAARPGVVGKLPAWIRDKLERKEDFSRAFAALKHFFDKKRR